MHLMRGRQKYAHPGLLQTAHTRWQRALFIMGPHTQDLYDCLFLMHRIDKPMLNVDAAGIEARQIPHQLFIGWWILEGVFRHNGKQRLCPLFKPRLRNQPPVLHGLL